jgi:cytochrome c553
LKIGRTGIVAAKALAPQAGPMGNPVMRPRIESVQRVNRAGGGCGKLAQIQPSRSPVIRLRHDLRVNTIFRIFNAPLARLAASLLLLTCSTLASSQTTRPPFENTMAQRTLACTACHGAQGRAGPDGYYPRLAGKPAGYLYNQLLNFRDGRRHYGLMAQLIAPLSDDYLLEIAHYFSALDLPYPPPGETATADAVLQRGQALVQQGDAARHLPACVSCHGQSMTGVAPNIPGLLGLPRDYLFAQLGAWKSGVRRAQAPDCMAHIVSRMRDEDISAVARWLAAQALPASSKPALALPATADGEQRLACGSAPATAEVKP